LGIVVPRNFHERQRGVPRIACPLIVAMQHFVGGLISFALVTRTTGAALPVVNSSSVMTFVSGGRPYSVGARRPGEQRFGQRDVDNCEGI